MFSVLVNFVMGAARLFSTVATIKATLDIFRSKPDASKEKPKD